MAKEKAPLTTYNAVKDRALRLLSFRAHSEYELRDKLMHDGASEDDINAVIDFLYEYKFLDDRIYAARLAADLSHIKKYGKYRIIAELTRKGIPREIISETAETLETDEEEQLLPLMERKLAGDFEQKSRDRAFRYFASRGYGFDDIKAAFNRIKDGEGTYIEEREE